MNATDPRRALRILHLNLASPGMGGKERLLVDFFDHSRGSRHEVSICCFDEDNPTTRALRERGCRLWLLPRGSGLRDRRLTAGFGRVVREARPDVIHSHGISTFLLVIREIALRRDLPLVFTCHSSGIQQAGVKRLLTALAMRRANGLVGVSKAAVQALAHAYLLRGHRVELIYNGVDTRRFAPSRAMAQRPPTIAFCGVFRPEKQIPLLLRAVAAIRGRGLSVRLLLVGDGPCRSEYDSVVSMLGLREDVEFVGPQEDVRPWLDRAACFALPSNREAMPVALLEAMAMGKAVVACRVGGVPEVVEDGHSGLLVSAGDVDGLAREIGRVLADQDLRARLGAEARRTVEARFCVSEMMRKYAALYDRVAAV